MFCPLAAIINVTVVIDVYFPLTKKIMYTLAKRKLPELTYFIMSALYLTFASAMHFEMTVCMLFICCVCLYRCVCVYINVTTCPVCRWPFNVLIMFVTYCALIGRILKLAVLLVGEY